MEERLVLMLPPKILIRLGLVEEGELGAVDKALYGFRESPRCWGPQRCGYARDEGGVADGSPCRGGQEED